MPRVCAHLRILLRILCWLSVALMSASARDTKPRWVRINSAHFSVLTDALEKNRNEAILRLEQMRVVFGQVLMRTRLTMPEPLEVIAFQTREEYALAAPLRDGQPISQSGFFLPGDDRNYIVLDLSDDESWRAISRQFAAVFLSYNYPPTQSWFDEGFAEYFSSLRLDDRRAQIGADPASLSAVLNAHPWLPIPELFAAHLQPVANQEGAPPSLFQAESWILMHYLLDQKRLPETGTYFDLVENQKLPIEQAVQQAYGVTAAQFGQAVRDYFASDGPRLQLQEVAKLGTANLAGPVQQFPAPLGPDDVGTSLLDVPDAEAQAGLAEMALRLPERHEQATKQLQDIIEQPKGESAVADRALAWAALQQQRYDQAAEELAKASEISPNDIWVRYYLALTRYDQARSSGKSLQGMANVMQDLHAVLDSNPDFAEAYNMLAVTQMEGGGINAAITTMRAAIQLNPRSQVYLLNMADIYIAGKKWDAATALLDRLKDSQNPQIARAARKDLDDMPTLRKYGILPQQAADAATPSAAASSEERRDTGQGETSDTPVQAAPEPDFRKSQFLQGKLVSVDCSHPPVAVVRVAAGGKTMRLRTEDYKSLLLIGADDFSCDWKSLSVVINYKAGGKADGDLVSLELR